jgi:F1F0 ATPase subunit 2
MNDPTSLSLFLPLSLLSGMLLGAFFFGGLWWTVSKATQSQLPGVWILCSLLVRMSVALAGFYFVSNGHWERLLLCLVGFTMSRVVVTWLTRPCEERRIRAPRGAEHAP